MRPGWSALAAGLALAGCSWDRFDDVTKNAPVVLLKRPSQLRHGFGVTLATATRGSEARLLVAGEPGQTAMAVFDLGSGESPNSDAIDVDSCLSSASDFCWVGNSVALLPHSLEVSDAGVDSGVTDRDFCLVSGLGRLATDAGEPKYGVSLRCREQAGAEKDVLQAPAALSFLPARVNPTGEVIEGPRVTVAADADPSPWLVVAWPSEKAAWYYGPDLTNPVYPVMFVDPASAPPETDLGTSVAVQRLSSTERLFALGAPKSGHVWLWHATNSEVKLVGCLGGPPGFGRALASGPVDRDGTDDLVVSDDFSVSVISGAALGALDTAPSPACSPALPAGALLASFGCGTTSEVGGCDGSGFGASLAVGDLDGNGDGEILVGAPRLRVRQVEHAGAVLVFAVGGSSRFALVEAKFLSSADSDDQLGSAVAAPRLGNHSIIAAGAPGGGKLALFYCSSLLPPGLRGARCK